MLLGMKRLWIPLLAISIWTPPLLAQLELTDADTKAKCAKYLETPLPTEASLTAAPKTWPKCDSTKLYSGIGIEVDYTAARQCAWTERLAIQAGIQPRFTTASVFGGSAMLTVLYANGEGVERNIPLALRFACEAEGAPAEIEGRLESLGALEVTLRPQAKRFDFCDDITSGFMEGFCAAYGSEMGNQDRENSFRALAADFTAAQRAKFDTARGLEEAYALAHAKDEIDLGGTARAMYQIDAEDTLKDDFLEALRSFEAAKFPAGSAELYRDSDEQLNYAYRRAIDDADKHKSDYGAVQPEGVRDAERAWLKYRDAWVAFAKTRYPTVSPEAWLILLTKDRTSILDGSFCDMDAVDGPCAQKGDTWKPSPLL
jgi:uncharacterized protein YecT (DUF1311 family)